MIKVFAPVLLVIIAVGWVGCIYYFTRYRLLARKVKFARDPLHQLTRKQRRDHVKELLERQQETYELQQQKQFQDVVFGKTTVLDPTHRNEGIVIEHQP